METGHEIVDGETQANMSDSAKSERAKNLHDRQRHYDMLHHKKRILWLSETPCLWGDGTAVPEYLRINLLNSSLRIVEQGISSNSVDLNAANYLYELDGFERQESRSHQ
ncbi:hypothetical protein QM327_16750 [Pantoea dispersa]|uniref:hypothetical protein n=1 Tax=Pantoea dispersa TaxID=59814 RepID=UPI0024B6E1EF|nr:hypothetical protein [Pantoea dispersa]MDI9768203.1 hypothetical protein [Pantoea dispersa]